MILVRACLKSPIISTPASQRVYVSGLGGLIPTGCKHNSPRLMEQAKPVLTREPSHVCKGEPWAFAAEAQAEGAD